jgi:hypothetical protein
MFLISNVFTGNSPVFTGLPPVFTFYELMKNPIAISFVKNSSPLYETLQPESGRLPFFTGLYAGTTAYYR